MDLLPAAITPGAVALAAWAAVAAAAVRLIQDQRAAGPVALAEKALYKSGRCRELTRR